MTEQAQKQSDIPKIGCVNHDCDKCQQAQKQEPDDLHIAYMCGLHRGKELAQRPWVGLTDEEANKIYKDGSTFGEMMRMVEAKLKEKNT